MKKVNLKLILRFSKVSKTEILDDSDGIKFFLKIKEGGILERNI